jgi:hypothetical protein
MNKNPSSRHRLIIQHGILQWLAMLLAILCNPQHAGAVGATVPFTTYEAEAGTRAGGATLVALTTPPADKYSSPVLEASGRAYVQLNGTGQSVTWTNSTSTSFTAMMFRICIPDSPSGTGTTATLNLYVNGVFRQAINLSSLQTWDYGYSTGSQNPADGHPYDFYQEGRVFITGAAIAPGSTIKLQQDAANTAAYYYVDCIDLENPPAALTQPANSLSIASYGAVANSSSVDNTTAIQNCINAAQSTGKSVWIPSGTYYLGQSNGVSATGITIQGAGIWYSTLYHNSAPPSYKILNLVSCTVKNLALDCNGLARGNNDGGGIVIKGAGWLIDSVWAEHVSSMAWASGSNGTVQNCRVTHVWGDGINLNNGGGGGTNLTAQNNYIRGSVDDSIAVDSASTNGDPQMTNISVLNNTVISPRQHGIAVYGGNGVKVKNNLVSGGHAGQPGMSVASFGNQSFAPQNVVLQGNTVKLSGTRNGSNAPVGALVVSGYSTSTVNLPTSLVWIGSNTIQSALFSGIQIFGTGSVTSTAFENNTISSPGTSGIQIDPTAWGNTELTGNSITGLGTGQVAVLNNSSANFVTTTPVQAVSYSSSFPSTASGGPKNNGTYVGSLHATDYVVYNNVNLNGVTDFDISEASANALGLTIQVRVDSPTGPLLGTCSTPNTGDWFNWTTQTCQLTGASGTHNVYLIGAGTSGSINFEWLGFTTTVDKIYAVDYDSAFPTSGGPVNNGTYVGSIHPANYVVYNGVNLNGVTSFAASMASANAVGFTVQVRLDSPTGTLLGTCSAPNTGDWFNWVTQTCPLTGASGTHNIYLVAAGTSGGINLEWLAFH